MQLYYDVFVAHTVFFLWNRTEMKKMGIIDGIVLEPHDGAHEDVDQATRRLERAVLEQIAALQSMTVARLTKNRHEKFRGIGSYSSHFRRIIYSEVEQLQNAVAVGFEAVKKSERIRTIAKPVRKNHGKSDDTPANSAKHDLGD